jgi:hypothetical protein
MSLRGEQVVRISAVASSFTASCAACADIDDTEGFSGSAFAGRLDLDLEHGTFLCRRGHAVRVERVAASPSAEAAA